MEFLVLRILILKHKTKSLKKQQHVNHFSLVSLHLGSLKLWLVFSGLRELVQFFSQEVSTGAAVCKVGSWIESVWIKLRGMYWLSACTGIRVPSCMQWSWVGKERKIVSRTEGCYQRPVVEGAQFWFRIQDL